MRVGNRSLCVHSQRAVWDISRGNRGQYGGMLEREGSSSRKRELLPWCRRVTTQSQSVKEPEKGKQGWDRGATCGADPFILFRMDRKLGWMGDLKTLFSDTELA